MEVLCRGRHRGPPLKARKAVTWGGAGGPKRERPEPGEAEETHSEPKQRSTASS